MKKNIIILLTGSGGSGKSTVANLLVQKYGFTLIDGDQIDTEFFPSGGQWLPENENKLDKAHEKIISTAKSEFNSGKNVVIDYIIFGNYQSFFHKLRNEFQDRLRIKVLFPSECETILRDEERSCWTTGPERIKIVREELLKIKQDIRDNNFLDTSNQTPEETISVIIKEFKI